MCGKGGQCLRRMLDICAGMLWLLNGYLEQGFIVYQLNVVRTEQSDCWSK
ncbi:hypothetical protein HNR55_001254 [Acetobacter lovaniensis]|uniref:Uncharacterized protein n=1 Tax=Acetobacter lovaniensis TaxID=104100 RepID=A0A841QEM9_9PROT|nr:hypothetical protein [Acetobacter lovaniensis]